MQYGTEQLIVCFQWPPWVTSQTCKKKQALDYNGQYQSDIPTYMKNQSVVPCVSNNWTQYFIWLGVSVRCVNEYSVLLDFFLSLVLPMPSMRCKMNIYSAFSKIGNSNFRYRKIDLPISVNNRIFRYRSMIYRYRKFEWPILVIRFRPISVIQNDFPVSLNRLIFQ